MSDWLKLNAEESDLKKRLKEADAALDAKAYAKYPKLTESEIKSLVVDDKWLAALDAAVHGEMDRVSQQLTQRVKELAERYETPLPQMVEPRDRTGIQGELPPEEDGVLVDVRPGYKQTDVGVIPEDWEVKQIGDLEPFVTSGSRGWAAFYSERGSPFIRITNLSRTCIYLDLHDLRFVNVACE